MQLFNKIVTDSIHIKSCILNSLGMKDTLGKETDYNSSVKKNFD